jgi:hypothetical protein
MRALEADIARYAPEAELIVLPARNPAGARRTSIERATRPTVDARFAARTTLARERVGRHPRLAG